LAPEQRALFELVHSGGLSHAEAAETLGLTANAVKLRMHRMTTTLRDALAGYLDENC
jgi:DNA-directed RNA polymerase specialized sigma24 family protein